MPITTQLRFTLEYSPCCTCEVILEIVCMSLIISMNHLIIYKCASTIISNVSSLAKGIPVAEWYNNCSSCTWNLTVCSFGEGKQTYFLFAPFSTWSIVVCTVCCECGSSVISHDMCKATHPVCVLSSNQWSGLCRHLVLSSLRCFSVRGVSPVALALWLRNVRDKRMRCHVLNMQSSLCVTMAVQSLEH